MSVEKDEIIEAQPVAAPLAPSAEAERLGLLDALRGFAIFGILLVNMSAYAHPLGVRFVPLADASRADVLVTALIRTFADGKFYALFSFLFGVGLALQEARALAAGRDYLAHQLRRLGVLAGLGLLHGLLIWAGDILFMYSVVGFVAVLMRRIPDRILKGIAAAGFVLPVVGCGLFSGVWALTLPLLMEAMNKQGKDFATEITRAIEQDYVAYQGTFVEVARARVGDFAELLGGTGLSTAPQLLALFLVGLLVGRSGALRAPQAQERLLRSIAAWGLPVGLTVSALYAFFAGRAKHLDLEPGLLFATMASFFVGAPILAAAYGALFVRAYSRRAPVLLRVLEPVGRMALTNYLLQSVVCTTLFYGYGGGLYGKVYPAAGLALAVALFMFQIVLSHLWLSAFRFGPVEWAWRALTYGHRPPMRRTRA